VQPEQRALWDRIESYELDQPGVAFPFSAKLAQENHWTRAYAKEAIREYKRFLFLAVAAGHPVSPSHDVDEVWHLHLMYSEEYHVRFCPQILGRPFHHYPSQGGPEEGAKLQDWYAKTLASYERFFGEPAPSKFWPRPRAQTSSNPPRKAHWSIPMPAALYLVASLAATSMVLGCVGSPGATSPFDYTGPDFLAFYFWLEVGCLCAAGLSRHLLRVPARSKVPYQNLDPDSVAFLNGGPRLAAIAATVSLVHRDVVQYNASTRKFETRVEYMKGGSVLENRLFSWLQKAGPVGPHNLVIPITSECAQLELELGRKGLILSPANAVKAVLIPVTISLIAPIVGVIKIFIGISRDRPVEFLVMLCLLSVIATVALFCRAPKKTRLGDSLLQEMKDRYGYLSFGYPAHVTENSQEMMLSVGLFGTAALATGPQSQLTSAFELPSANKGFGISGGSNSGCGSNSNCGGGSSCGGGGGGCGGGGGGCGGCGGGH
jgi:uncharacterized protein (TIGR04222 family)